jgi:hypothetical protein
LGSQGLSASFFLIVLRVSHPILVVVKLFVMLMSSKEGLESKFVNVVPQSPHEAALQTNCKNLLAILEDINLSHLLHQDS